jgi:gas vesicle protein
MNILLILFVVIAAVFATYVVLLYTGKLIDKDGDFIPDVVEDAVEEVKERVDRVKEEITDVKEAVKEVANQAGDVVEAAKGKKRRGRPKKKK